MKLPRRRFLQLAAGAATCPLLPTVASAQAYPSRPVRIIVGFAPGGSTDIGARVIGQWLAERLGQSFVVENRPGAGSNIAAEAVVRAAPDGYTLLLISSSDSINATLYPKLSFNFIRDITPVACMTRAPQILMANPALPAKTFPELIAYAKANPGKISIASAGNGAISHLSGELLKMMAGVDFVHVPYRGAGPALTDLLTGHVQIAFVGLAGAIEYLRTAKLRGLAVSTTTRSETMPDIPTISEFVPGYEAVSYFGLGAPRTTPAEVIDKLNSEVNTALTDPKIKARIFDSGGVIHGGSPAAFAKLIADDTEKWAKVIREAKVSLQ
jgi:tripartite-type tricarboxylate transporter receptor subunit TctC